MSRKHTNFDQYRTPAEWQSIRDETPSACDDDDCRGWIVSESSEYGECIERCDQCGVFPDDYTAAQVAAFDGIAAQQENDLTENKVSDPPPHGRPTI